MPYTITADTDGAVIADTDGALFWTIWEPLLGFTESTRPFYVAEITAYEPSVGEHVIYVSDLGYRTTGTPVQTYPPLLQDALEPISTMAPEKLITSVMTTEIRSQTQTLSADLMELKAAIIQVRDSIRAGSGAPPASRAA